MEKIIHDGLGDRLFQEHNFREYMVRQEARVIIEGTVYYWEKHGVTVRHKKEQRREEYITYEGVVVTLYGREKDISEVETIINQELERWQTPREKKSAKID